MLLTRCWSVVVLAALIGVSPVAGAQEVRTVQGQVVDAADNSPLPGTVIVALGGANSMAVVAAGRSGAFRMQLPMGSAHIVARRLGFAPETVPVGATQTAVTVRLLATSLALDPLTVLAERGFSTASSATIRAVDIRLRPQESSQELLSLIPGVAIAQHAGGGKAEQIFARGFDADHGTDVAIAVDGTPVNMVSHAHGQGYADLHFLIPEIVSRVEVRKGPYDARDGDHATAAAVEFRTLDRLPAGAGIVRAGSFRTGQAIGLVPLGGDAAQPGGYLAAAVHTSDGPFEAPQDYRRHNVFSKWTMPVARHAELVASASVFAARWDASGQIPERAVPIIGRFGAIDPTEGGNTSRNDVSLGLRSLATGDTHWEARAFATRYNFRLFSNFTFFLNDSINGDGIEQVDDRVLAGFRGSVTRPYSVLGRSAVWSAGAGTRMDRADVLLGQQRERERLGVRVDAHIAQDQFFGWTQHQIELSPRVRLQLGVRADAFHFDVLDRANGAVDLASPNGSGTRWQRIVSPKANLAIDISSRMAGYLNFGSGFHSNDARDVLLAQEGDRVLPRAVGGEVGARHSWTGGSIAAAAWLLDMQSELVYVGDEGVTEPSGRTRRTGIDVEGRVRVLLWLWADADLNLSRGRLRDAPAGEDRIPLAPSVTSTGGLTVREAGRFESGLRYRFIGNRPADEANTVVARGISVWEAFGRYRLSDFAVIAAVNNLFGAEWNEAQFATTSRLRDEPEGVTELHFTPGSPRTLQFGFEYRF